MPLSTHLKQGQLLYFTDTPDAISVLESTHFRWLTFGDVIQSLMKRSSPHQLTLPHHIAIIQPLLLFTPKRILEFGLGGGTMTRFLRKYFPETIHHVLESNKQVIDLYHQFFNIPINTRKNKVDNILKNKVKIIHSSAEEWIANQHPEMFAHDWLIYDIYQHQDIQKTNESTLLFSLIEQLTDLQTLSINIPFSTTHERALISTICSQKSNTHLVNIYSVPQYQNWIFHLIPRSLTSQNISTTNKSYIIENMTVMPAYLLKVVQNYHQQFIKK